MAAAVYVELNHAVSVLARQPEPCAWSSAWTHLTGTDDQSVEMAPLLKLAPDRRKFVSHRVNDEETMSLHKHERTGRPLGSDSFLNRTGRRGQPLCSDLKAPLQPAEIEELSMVSKGFPD